MPRVASLCLLAAMSATAFAGPHDDGFLVATETSFGDSSKEDHLYVHRVKPTGIEPLYAATMYHSDFGFSDARTLWALDPVGRTVHKLVDGKLVETIKLASIKWRADDVNDLDLTMHVTVKSEVWLSYCRKHKKTKDGRECARRGSLRIDVTPFSFAGKQAFKDRLPRELDQAKQPAGYKVQLQTVTVHYNDPPSTDTRRGAVCTGPGNTSVTWPDGRTYDPAYDEVPTGVTWLQAVTPLARLDLKGRSPGGDGDFFTSVYFLDCKEIVADALDLRGGLWGVLRVEPFSSAGIWTIYARDKVIGTLGTVPVSDIRVAPH